MHKLLQLCKPAVDEVIFFFFFAIVLLFATHARDLWLALLSTAQTDQDTAELFGSTLKETISNATNLSDPQIVNAFIWGLTAALGLMLAAGIADFIRAEADDERLIHQQNGAVYFVTRLTLRISAFVGLIAFAVLFATWLFPALGRMLLTGIVHPLETWFNIPLAVFAVVMTAFCLYVFALLIRLLLLRVRVFSTYIG
jgi:hypothetical protein